MSAATRLQAEPLLRSVLRKNWSHAAAWHVLADLRWDQRRIGEAALAYAIASLVAPHNEHYARAYADALLHEGRAEEGLAWLEDRVHCLGRSLQGVSTWITWISVLEDRGYPERALAAYSQAVEQHPTSIALAGFAVPFLARMACWDEARTQLDTLGRTEGARIAESKESGGSSFYDRIYVAERPELFFKSAGWRVIGPGNPVRIRTDASWSVPEPELTLVVNPLGKIVGYTIGNDMSSRDIEGENPLYLPQAKIYDGSCALGPAILLADEPLPQSTSIEIEIQRNGATAFQGITSLAELKRDPAQLVEYLFRDQSFPHGAFLMTGTGIVPGDDFTLLSGDTIRISISGIGTLENPVA